ncbi:MAG TPA: nitroreductase family protein [Candidatus Dormibacteraeota bacterium]|nr:nitroreductase family protein [Candidatus Dormibacteraeota bacterium]
MEYKQVIGRRRSIRYFVPYRPVEREKIQAILEAARICSQAVNANWAKAIVVRRDDLSEEDREALKTPTTTAQLDLAPVWIFWYGDPSAPTLGQTTLKGLVDVGALNPSHGWSHAYVDDVVWTQVLTPIMGNQAALLALTGCEAGLAICQAMLMAVDLGLGTGINAFNSEKARAILNPPDHWIPLWVQLVGYPAESPDGGGQRPRQPFESLYFEGRYGVPFERDESVVNELTDAGMLQPPAPLPWRLDEVRALARMFGLPE